MSRKVFCKIVFQKLFFKIVSLRQFSIKIKPVLASQHNYKINIIIHLIIIHLTILNFFIPLCCIKQESLAKNPQIQDDAMI